MHMRQSINNRIHLLSASGALDNLEAVGLSGSASGDLGVSVLGGRAQVSAVSAKSFDGLLGFTTVQVEFDGVLG